jgi:hypothetical protein
VIDPPPPAAGTSAAPAATPVASPAAGHVAIEVAIEAARLNEAHEAVRSSPLALRGSRVTGTEADGALAVELWLEYAGLDRVLALLEALRRLARRVGAARVWCAACARWHPSADGGRTMAAPPGSACHGPLRGPRA